MHTNTPVQLKPNLMSSLFFFVMYFIKYTFSLITLNIKTLHSKDPKRLTFHIFGLKCFINAYHFKAVHDDLSAKTVPI